MSTEVNNEYDLSLPISSLLRVGTSKAHEDAENSQGGVRLVKGELDKEEYVYFLMMLWHIYDELERGLETHASYPTLQPTYNPILLARTRSLSEDISYLLGVSEGEWQMHPMHRALMASPPKPFVDYTMRLQELCGLPDPSRLLAHAYVRYLGDMSGGQFIRRRIAKAYDLDADRGDGIRFYDFKKLGSSELESANMGDLKKIKEWYREGMDAGVGDDVTLKVAVLEEANDAFKLNSGIFELLSGPEPRVHRSQQPESAASRPERSQAPRALYEPILVSFGGLISVLMTVGLAHFVIMGAGSASGNCALRGVEPWLRRLLSAA
ncbi:heme oxygenase-like protein [Rhizopogon vinicolor AM-OR11-026]|uniref:Heme oxygenase-like protein n=1 Tax=Rhizopogon vinicolor AM-OR11-026 TaxID=1314800 RepID=A0A1B7NHX5_9AGAM|nr:heme oxygenase-like protein [Rhizopogon vinicolor AM-OR11-026]